MLRLISIIFLLFIGNSSFAQGETWNWCFGDSAGIKFINGKTPVAMTSFKGWSYEGTSIINDSSGKVVLYSYSYQLYDSNDILQNKDFILKGGWAVCQPIQLIRHRKSKDVHIFTTSPVSGVSTDGFNHIIYNNGFKTKYKRVFFDIGEKQTSMFHQNNNDIWVTAHSLPNDTFYSFLVTKYGLIECPVINKIGAKYVDVYPTQGLMKFSPSGKYCANANWDLNRIELYRYDKENSRLYDLIAIVQNWTYSLEFSPDEKFLYFTSSRVNPGPQSHLYQVNLDTWNKDSIEKSRKLIAVELRDDAIGQLQLGPDKKIYVSIGRRNALSVIEEPNKPDTACGYKAGTLYLGGRTTEWGLPNFNAGYFFTPSVDYAYEQDCRTNTIVFEGKDTIKASNYKWIFSKGTKIDTKTTKDATHTFADTGKWKVSYIANNGSRSDTATKTITIRPKLEQGFLGEDKTYCQILPILKAPKNLHCIHWYNDTLLELGKVDSLKPTKEGTYYAKATNLSFCVEWDTMKVIKISPKADYETKDVCENDTVVFINKSMRANNYAWKFGDGKTNNFENTKHKYQITNTTTYNVTLVAKMDACSDSITKAVTVNQNPESSFSYVLSGSDLKLKAIQTGLIKYEWRFGTTDSFTTTLPDYNRTINVSTQRNVCLKVTNLAGCVSITCKDVTVGISPILKDNDIKIYPTPSKGKISIEITRTGNYTAKIFNNIGQLVYDKNLKGLKAEDIDLKLSSGNYTLVIEDNEGNSATKKIVLE